MDWNRKRIRCFAERAHFLWRNRILPASVPLAVTGALFWAASCQQEREPETPGPDEAWWEVENSTTATLVELNLVLSPVAGDAWGPDQLVGDGLAPAKEFRLVDVPCPLVYDMRAAAQDGQEAVRTGVDFACEEIVTWEVTSLD